MDAQEMHDYAMSKRKALSEGSRERLEALLKAKEQKIAKKKYIYRSDDSISMAMRDSPGLTREEAEEMASSYGF